MGYISILEFLAIAFKYSISVLFSVTGKVFGCKPTDVNPDLEATFKVLSRLSLSSNPGSPVHTL